MTAIAMLYDPPNGRFVIAADGRCSGITDIGTVIIKSESEQKIFHMQGKHVNIAYAITGIASSVDGSFQTMAEAERQIRTLVARDLSNSVKFKQTFCSKMTRMVEKARQLGRFPRIPQMNGLPAEEAGRAFIFYVLGFRGKLPFGFEARFYVDEQSNRVTVRPRDFDVSGFCARFTGSDAVAGMLFGNVQIDPRISQYKCGPNPDALAAATNYIRACSDPRAIEIDPWCKIIGGKIHAAEIDKEGFRWLIPPASILVV